MWVWLWIGTALAGSRWDGLSGDVVVTADVSRPPEEVTAAFADLSVAMPWFDESCARDVTVLSTTEANLVWDPSWVRRKVIARVGGVQPGRRVRWSLDGKLGFEVTVEVVPREGGSTVTVTTPLYAPGWPLRRMYFQDIRPTWARCYARALSKLDPGANIVSITDRFE